MELIEATLQAVRDRLRPILMTSLAFGLGVLPLALATGAGSGAQRAIGTGVLGGMIVGTLPRHLLHPAVLRRRAAPVHRQAQEEPMPATPCRPGSGAPRPEGSAHD